VALAEETAGLTADLILVDSHHHHERDLVVQHHSQQVIFVHLQPLLLRLAERLVPGTNRLDGVTQGSK